MMKEYKGKLDRIGIAVSFLCLIHCVVLPVFITTLSLAGIQILHNSSLEVITLLAAIITGALAMLKGHRKHGQSAISIVFAFGIILMITGNFVLSETFESLCKAAGAFIVISAHIINYRISRCEVIPVKEN